MDVYPDKIRVEATLGDRSEEKRKINIIFTKTSLGSGKSGHVIEANISETGENVAVKRIDITDDDDPMEVEYLKTLNHCNVVKLLYHFGTTTQTRKVQYILMERIPRTLFNLYHIPVKMPLLDIKLYIYQLIRSVGYIHNLGICHRDIKPKNLLIDISTGVLKLCDFGLSTNLSLKEFHSTRTGTRQYHAPELLLGFKNYTDSVDLWAIGCILVELLKGQQQLFRRQPDAARQLMKLIEVFGTPDIQSFAGLLPPYQFKRLPYKERRTWVEIIFPNTASDEAISLCNDLLCYAPNSRILPHKALGHKFFDELRLLESQFQANGKPLPPLFNFQPGEFAGDFDHLIPSHLNEKDDE